MTSKGETFFSYERQTRALSNAAKKMGDQKASQMEPARKPEVAVWFPIVRKLCAQRYKGSYRGTCFRSPLLAEWRDR